MRRLKDNTGAVLLVVLWTLLILSVLAVSLGRNASIELSLVKYALAKAKSKYLAWAGIIYAIDQIRQDSGDPASNQQDTLYDCAVPSHQGKTLEELFKEQPLRDGHFTVQHFEEDAVSATPKIFYGLRDEERKINVNALTSENVMILSALLTDLGSDEETAQTIAFSVLDWKDEDGAISKEGYGAEDAHYMGLDKPYHCKNRPLDSKEELLLVQGMTPEIFDRVKDFVTIFPQRGNLKINLDTVSERALRAAAGAFSGSLTNTESSDADSLVRKMLEYRRGEDGEDSTADDRLIDLNLMGLNAKETVLFLMVSQFQTRRSDYIHIQSHGVEQNRDVQTRIDAIVSRDDLSIHYWHRDY